ncbi:MAG: sensor histidine kinase [Gemmatimonadaceae bacterium]
MSPDRHPLPPTFEWMLPLLRVPLVAKVAGANAIIVLAAIAAAVVMRRGSHATEPLSVQLVLIVALALAGSFVLNTGLVVLALRPLQHLESAAISVSQGDFDSRVQQSVLADRDVAHVGSAINLLLNGMAEDRARTRTLAATVIGAGDRERAYVARELHDSIAQTLAALVMQLGAAVRDCPLPELSARLETIKALGSDSLEEVRMLSHTMHPRVLDDLGIIAALEHLAHEAGERTGVMIDVNAALAGDLQALSTASASVLYRVAQEGIGNAVRHAHPRVVHVRIAREGVNAMLEIADDGDGFDVSEAGARRPGMGLFTMQERVSLVGGRFSIASERGAGTTVVARVPLSAA